MYIGPSTDDPPIARPATKREATSDVQFQARAQPRAETRYRMAITRRLSRRPYRSPGIPASIAPTMVPQSAIETVSPRDAAESWYSNVRACVVPAITAVSNPNSRPPRPATTVLLSRHALSFMCLSSAESDVRLIVTCPDRNYVVVKISTSEAGLYGVGDATLNGRELAVAEDLKQHIAPLLIGRDPEQIEDTWQYLYRGPYWRGGPVQMTALAGVDLALWDIKGKRAGMPVYQLLGGRTRIGALAYTHASGRDFAEVEDGARHAIERGFKCVRAQVAIPGLEGTYGTAGAKPAEAAAGPGAHMASLPQTGDFEPPPHLSTLAPLLQQLRAQPRQAVQPLAGRHRQI